MELWLWVLCLLVVVGVLSHFYSLFSRKKVIFQDSRCFVTGGSRGTGRALAILLAKEGANVAIVGRDASRLSEVLETMKRSAKSPSQKFHSISCDVSSKEQVNKALEDAEKALGSFPEFVFSCAGASHPGFFVEQDISIFENEMKVNFFGALHTVHEAASKMIQKNIKGRFVLVSSVLGYFGLVGYSQYCPTKFALRGLFESLRSEFQLHDLEIHICFPATILSPGLEEENRTKPKVTLAIEEGSGGSTPEEVAQAILTGVHRGHSHITVDWTSELFRVGTRGLSPSNNFVLDSFIALVAWFVLPIIRLLFDKTIKDERAKAKKLA